MHHLDWQERTAEVVPSLTFIVEIIKYSNIVFFFLPAKYPLRINEKHYPAIFCINKKSTQEFRLPLTAYKIKLRKTEVPMLSQIQ